ncbi:hypothetical protein SAMN04487865_103410 [Succinivibrio dextrinosolvens]|uniref:FHA domain-containing protein n=2 Tax=Succinivibrio dextrinosolvens TaxID=83771 RepID=A0A662ZA68_9GAMM|nr:hypothetical protein SAMN04487865_103410 [Succinivibrio dextrinosolvens]
MTQKRLVLMHNETELLVFNYNTESRSFSFKSCDFNLKNFNFLPTHFRRIFDLCEKSGINAQQIFSEAMARFLKFRVISLQREYSRKVMEYLKVRGTDDFGSMFDRLYFVSLNDVLWVKSYNSPVKYADINPYSNPLDPAIASLVLTGNADCFKSAQQSAFSYFAIDLSASGTQNKVWFKDNGTIMLYKTDEWADLSSPDCTYVNNQVYAEYFAYQIASFLGINSVKHDLEVLNYQGKKLVCSKCPLINGIDCSLVTMTQALDELDYIDQDLKTSLQKQCDYATAVDEKALSFLGRKQFADQSVLDMLLLNPDRHKDNYSLLKDNKTLEYRHLSMCYDNGLTLFALSHEYEMESLVDGAMNGTFISGNGVNVRSRFLTLCDESYLELLNKFRDFEFSNFSLAHFNEEHLIKITRCIRKNAQNMIELLEQTHL